jgi:hypothetical protein
MDVSLGVFLFHRIFNDVVSSAVVTECRMGWKLDHVQYTQKDFILAPNYKLDKKLLILCSRMRKCIIVKGPEIFITTLYRHNTSHKYIDN